MAHAPHAQLEFLRAHPSDDDAFLATLAHGAPHERIEALRLRAGAVEGDPSMRLWCAVADSAEQTADRQRALAMAARSSIDDAAWESLARALDAGAASDLVAFVGAGLKASPPRSAALPWADALIDVAGDTDKEALALAWLAVARRAPARAADALAALEQLAMADADAAYLTDPLVEVARATGDRRALLRALDHRLRSASGTDALAVLAEIVPLAFETTKDADIALDYIEDALAEGHAAADLQPIAAALASSCPPSPRIHDLRRQLADRAGDRAGAAALATELAGLTGDASARAALLLDAGASLAAGGDIDGALERYLDAVRCHASARGDVLERLDALADARPDATRALRRTLIEEAGDWPALHAMMSGDIDAAEGHPRLDALWTRFALERAQLDRPDLAIATLDQIHAEFREPDVLARETAALLDLSQEPRVIADVVSRLEPRLARAKRWDELTALIARHAVTLSDPEARAQRHETCASLLFEQMGRGHEAVVQLDLAVDVAPHHTHAWDLSRRIRLEAGDVDGALRQLSREFGLTDDDGRRRTLEAERSRILNVGRGLAVALDDAFSSLVEHPDASPLRAAFGTLVLSDGGIDEARKLARTFADRGDDAHAAELLWLSAEAAVLASDAGVALAFDAAATSAPTPVRLHQLAEHVRARAIDAEVDALLRLFVDHGPAPEDRIDARVELAERHTAATEHSQAAARWAEVITLLPNDERAHRGLIASRLAAGDVTGAADALERLLADVTLDDRATVDALQHLSMLYDAELGRPDLAYDAARRVLGIRPEDSRAAMAVQDYAHTGGAVRDAYETLLATVQHIGAGPAQDARQLELAELAQSQLDAATALPHWRAVASGASLNIEDRRRAARTVVDAAVDDGTDSDGAEAVTAAAVELELIDPTERGERAEWLVDALVDARKRSAARAVARLATAEPTVHDVFVLDRRATLAMADNDVDDARAALGAWYELDSDGMPIDRLARLTRLTLQYDGASDSARSMATRVLLADPDQPDVVRALGECDPDVRAEVAESLSDAGTVATLARRASLHTVTDPTSDDAVAAWRAVLETEPTHEQALAYLEHALKQRGDQSALADLHMHRADLLGDDDGARADALRRAAQIDADPVRRERALLDLLEIDLGDRSARADLAQVYRSSERWSDLAAHMEESVGMLDAPDAILKTLDGLADIYLEHLDAPDRAVDALERKAQVRPLDPQTLDRLIPCYAQLGRTEDETRAMLKRATMHEDEDERAAALRVVATRFERDLENYPAAIDALRKVLAFEPGNLTVIEEIARLQMLLGEYNATLQTLEQLAAASGVRELRAEVYVRAATLMHEKLDRHRDALELLMRAVESLPQDDALLDLARACGEASKGWAPLAGVLRTAALAAEPGPARVALEAEVGRTLDENADDAQAALSWLLEAFRREPTPGPVLDHLEQMAERRGLRTHLVDVYKRLAQHSDDIEVRWRGFLGSANVAEVEVGRPDVAFDIIARAASEPALAERAELELERIARTHDLWDRHRAWLDDQMDQGAGDDTARVLHKAELEENEVGDWEAAFETIVAAYQDAPGPGPLRDALYRLADAHGAWELVVKLYELLQQQSDEPERIRHLLEMARISTEHLNDAGGGFTHTLRAWQLRPRDAEMRSALTTAAELADRRVDLLAAWEWEARSVELNDEKADALERCIALADELELTERTVAGYRELIKLQTQPDAVIDRLDERLGAEADRPLFVATLDAVAPLFAERDVRVRVRLRQATVLRGTGETDAAIVALDDALAWASEPEPVRDVLIEVLRESSSWEALAAQIETRLAQDADMDRVPFELELGEIYLEHLEDARRANSVFRRAALENRESSEAHDRYVSHLRSMDRFDDLVEYLVDAATHREGDERRAMLLDAAQIAEESLEDPRRAIRIVDRIVADIEDVDALALRARALGTLNRWNDHVETLKRIAAAAEGRPAAEALAQAAEALETQLFYGERAIDAWRDAAAADPTWAHACRELARLLAEHERFDDAEAALRDAVSRRGLDDAAGAWERADDAWALAALLDAHGTDVDIEELRALLESAVAADGHHEQARALYESVLERSGGVDELLALLDNELEAATDDRTRAGVLVRRAIVYHFDAGRTADARKALDRAQALDPNSPAPLAVSADIDLDTEALGEAARRYALLLGDAERVEGALLPRPRPLIAGEGVDGDLSLVYLVRAAVAAERAGRTDEAYDRFASANLEDESNLAALHGLARLSMLRGNLAGASVHVQNFLRYAELAPADLVAEMHELAGRIAESDGDLARAMTMYDAAAASSGGAVERDAVARSVDVALRSGNASAAVTRLKRLTDLSQNPAERANAMARMARAQIDAGASPRDAARSVQQALVLAPEPSAAIDAALDAVMTGLEPNERIEVLDEMLAVVESAGKRGRLMHHRARAVRDREGGWTEAIATSLAAAFGVLPDSAALLDDVVDAFSSLGNHRQLARVLASAVDRCAGDDEQAARVLDQLATVRGGALEDIAGAVEALTQLRMLRPGDDGVAERLLGALLDVDGSHESEIDALCEQLSGSGAFSVTLLDAIEQRRQDADDIQGVLYAVLVRQLAGDADEERLSLLEALDTSAPALVPGRLAPLDALGFGGDDPFHPAVLERMRRVSSSHGADMSHLPGTPTDDAWLRDRAMQIASAFGIDAVDVRVDEAQSADARIVSDAPLTITVSAASVAGGSGARADIALAAGISRARPEFVPIDLLSAFDYLAFFEAAVEPLGDAPVALDDDLQQRIGAWRERFGDAAEPPATRIDGDAVPGVGRYRDLVDAVGVRAAALVSGDPAATFMALLDRQYESHPSTVAGLRAVCGRLPAARSLVGWLLDGGYARARAALARPTD